MSVLSAAFTAHADERFAERADLLSPIASAIEEGLSALDDADERALIKSYYGTMPASDVFDVDFPLLASFAHQARVLRETSPWCRDVPEDVFIHYVASPRVNNEPLTDAWPTFRRALAGRLEGLDAYHAIVETNYWCAETATYQASDGRTLGPLGVLASGDGRCGEESTFLVTALRANGIPARQLYTPWWAHCDDNHAWVEAYADGRWHYLGACEPEEELDRGWFTAASGRAMLVHTRLFDDFGCDFGQNGHLLSREGSQVIVNLTESYAPTVRLRIRTLDASGAPVGGASVRLSLVNEATWRDIANLTSDAGGCSSIVVGQGTLRVAATTAEQMAERIIDTASCQELDLTLDSASTGCTEWMDFDVHAPADHPAHSHPLTPEQAERGRARKSEADRVRIARVAANVERAREIACHTGHGSDDCLPFFEQAFANADEIARFLTADGGADRAALLATLRSKDFRDLSADVLEDHVQGARAVRDTALAYLAREGVEEAGRAQELYERYVLCPRAHLEHLSPYRSFIRSFFTAADAECFVENPHTVWDYIRANTSFAPSEHVKKLAGTPRGALISRQAGSVTRRVLFVAICRTFGIPARINPVDTGIEYFAHGAFVPVERPEEDCEVVFASDAEHAPTYFQTWSIARFARFTSESGADAQGFKALDLYGRASFENGICRLRIPCGEYRLTTAVRLPSGDVQAAERAFSVEGPHGGAPIELKLREPKVSEMLQDIALDPFALVDGAGGKLECAAIAHDHGTDPHPIIISFLEPGMEPTEHLLNEMREKADRLNEAQVPIILAIQDGEQLLSDPTLARTLPTLSYVTVAYDDFSEMPERLARRMFTNPEKLPLSILAASDGHGGLTGLYATSGYNVGTVDLMLKLISLKS